jgi:D-tagatose-1,6-bisphosphate aldolase subunit GatZ/KbaZ
MLKTDIPMRDLDQIIKILISRNTQGKQPITLLAVCPNSAAVLEAAVRAAARNRSVMLFAATLNQVDYEASYTGWTPTTFVQQMNGFATKYHWFGPLYPCLDHGGPWLKDLHSLAKLSFPETMQKVKNSITACVQAGYRLLHIDPTVDRTLPSNNPLPIELVVDRTVELIAHAEVIRQAGNYEKLAYEVGTEEVHGGLVDIGRFKGFLSLLQQELIENNLTECWPCLLVAQIGTDLHTTIFKPETARQLNSILAPLGSMIKGHYTDWVENPAAYPASGMGAANVGPEFTAEEFSSLDALEKQERVVLQHTRMEPSNVGKTIEQVVIDSGRWKKWLLPDEVGKNFFELPMFRRDWLLKTGSRYIWTNERVTTARAILYKNLEGTLPDPHEYVVERITKVIEKYIEAFNLQDSIDILGE